ncbi:VOC family protein [Streptomyces gamaensis]|uniref:VOC family protein n=1 Tax=Streptomyces gamaensis TaxID=1763542 RepID=A0ABW0Z017_9ACTN
MPEVTGPYAPGTPCWVDLMVPEQQAALDFYRDLFGWQGQVGPPETGGYAVCELNGRPVAGIMSAMNPDGSAPEPAPPTVWTTYLAVADADAASRAITAAGGKVELGVLDVMDLGRMAVASDPTGAVFGIWQAKDFAGAGVTRAPGALVWNELNTPDVTAASAFYAAAFGIEATPMEGADGYFALKAGGEPVGGMQSLSNLPEGTPPNWTVYFAVDDCDSTVDALIRAGGNVLKPPFDMIAGRMAVVQDPWGGVFCVIKTKPMA